MDTGFEQLSLHQQIQFLQDFSARVRSFLPERRNRYLGIQEAPDEELISNNPFFRALVFAQDDHNQPQLQSIFRKLSPNQTLKMPKSLDYQAVILMVYSQMFLQYYPTLHAERILSLGETALRKLRAVTEPEAMAINHIIEFDSNGPTLVFRFHDRQLRCRLNRKTDTGFELTVLNQRPSTPTLR